jgi:hypothetical protein
MTMSSLMKAHAALALALLVSLTIPQPASGVSAELAKRCRAMMVETIPAKPAGTIVGNAQEERQYFRTCVARDGNMSQPSTVGRSGVSNQ